MGLRGQARRSRPYRRARLCSPGADQSGARHCRQARQAGDPAAQGREEESTSMSDNAGRIVQKLWSYCNVLRDDGLSYQDYLEQLTFLLFLKMADERAAMLGKDQPIPKGYR